LNGCKLLFAVESDFETPAEFTGGIVACAVEGASNELVEEFLADKFDCAVAADERIDFSTFVVDSVDFNTEVAVDFGCAHNCYCFVVCFFWFV
jgi:hypothetical protein